jgi:uncharacterized protein (TIGR02246 family)
MRLIGTLAFAIVLTGAPSLATASTPKLPAPESSVQPSDQQAIEAIVADQDAAWNAGDAQAYCRRMLKEATFTNIVGSFFVGRDAFAANMSGLFSGLFKGSINRQTVQSIRFITPDIAVVDTISSLSGFARVPVGAEAVDGVMHSRPEQVMVRRADGWWVASFHNVTINPRFLPKDLAG